MKTEQQHHLLVLNQFNDESKLDLRELYRKYLKRKIDAGTYQAVITSINYMVVFDYAVQETDKDNTCYKLTPEGVDYKNHLLELEFERSSGFTFTISKIIKEQIFA